jgi:fibronectin type 3 domain-containing protein
VEPHVAGYKIYRTQTDDGWQLLTAQPVKTAAYRDAAVTAGQRYRYRVNAVNDAGMESTPSGEAAEMAPMP